MHILRNKHHDIEPLWHVQLILIGVIILQIFLAVDQAPIARFGIPTLEFLLLVVLQIVTPKTPTFTSKIRRVVAVILIILISIANIIALQQLLQVVFNHSFNSAGELLSHAIRVYLTTLVTFALLYWEMDSGGPGFRRNDKLDYHDFLFPQQHYFHSTTGWYATFIDYLYISLTNMTNFTSSDTLPLSRRAKLLMSSQSIISLSIVVLVTAKAISLL